MCKNITLSKINHFLAFVANTCKSQGKSLLLLKERVILLDVTNKRLCIVVRNSSGVDKFYIVVQANWTCKLTVTQNYRTFNFSYFLYGSGMWSLMLRIFAVFVKKLLKKSYLLAVGYM
jgi:hypothetical protein